MGRIILVPSPRPPADVDICRAHVVPAPRPRTKDPNPRVVHRGSVNRHCVPHGKVGSVAPLRTSGMFGVTRPGVHTATSTIYLFFSQACPWGYAPRAALSIQNGGGVYALHKPLPLAAGAGERRRRGIDRKTRYFHAKQHHTRRRPGHSTRRNPLPGLAHREKHGNGALPSSQ